MQKLFSYCEEEISKGVRQILDKSLKKSMLFRVTNLKEIRTVAPSSRY